MKVWQFIKKTLLYTLLFSLISVFGLAGFAYLYKDKIIQLFIGELNKYINTPVELKKIDLNIWGKFPQTSLVLEEVVVKGSLANDSATFLKAKYLYLTFNVWEAINQQYKIHKIYIEDAQIHLVIDEKGNSNYEVYKNDSTNQQSGTNNKSSIFDLEKILLKNVGFRFENRAKNHDYNTQIHQANGKFSYHDEVMKVKLTTEITSNYLSLEGSKFLQNKKLVFESELEHELIKQQFIIKPSEIRLNESLFEVKGNIGTGDNARINLSVKGKNTTIKTLLSLMPEKIYNQLAIYKTKGDLYFNAIIEGKISAKVSPQILVEFGCKNSSVFHPDTKLSLNELSFNGLYNNGANAPDHQATLAIRDVVGTLNNQLFKGSFILNNFSNPFIQAELTTKQKVNDILAFYPVEAITKADGDIEVDLSFAGKTKDLTQKNAHDKIRVSGSTSLNVPFLKLKNYNLPITDLKLKSHFNNQELAIDEFTSKIGQSDLWLKGVILKVIPYLMYNNQILELDASFKSNALQLNELLAALPTNEKSKKDTINPPLTWPSNIQINLTCQANKLEFKKFKLKNAALTFSANDNNMSVKGLQTSLAGGNIKLDATISKTRNNKYYLESALGLQNVHIDTSLYLFDNFGQQFITEKNLEGQLTTQVSFYSSLNQKFEIEPQTIFCNAEISIKNGRLKNFEPLKQLSRVIDEKTLEDVKFQELKNTIHIENSTIYFPEMEIKSNLNSISVLGTHTFEGQMDYKLKVSLKNRNKRDKDEEFGIIKDDKTGNTQLFLSLKGTSDNIKISLDKQATKNKLKESWKKEKEEFKTLLKKEPPVEDKVIELNHEELIEME